MPNVFKIELDYAGQIFNKSVERAIRDKWNKAVRKVVDPVQNRLKYELVFGGRRINGFVQTGVYTWLKSAPGLGQIGLSNLSQLDDLLVGIADSIKAKSAIGTILVQIFDLSVIAKATPHPAVDSWFVDWIYRQNPVTDASFVQLTKLPSRFSKGNRAYLPRSFPIAGQDSGLMLQTGPKAWRAPSFLKSSIDSWLNRNVAGIKSLIIEETINILRTI